VSKIAVHYAKYIGIISVHGYLQISHVIQVTGFSSGNTFTWKHIS